MRAAILLWLVLVVPAIHADILSAQGFEINYTTFTRKVSIRLIATNTSSTAEPDKAAAFQCVAA